MVQTITTRYHDRNAPGFMVTAAQERETETAALPLLPQIISLTWGGTDPADAGDYVFTFPLPSGAYPSDPQGLMNPPSGGRVLRRLPSGGGLGFLWGFSDIIRSTG